MASDIDYHYRAGFMSVVVEEHPNTQATRLEMYADQHRILQRITAHPEIDWGEKNRSELWLYRLGLDVPLHMIPMILQASRHYQHGFREIQ